MCVVIVNTVDNFAAPAYCYPVKSVIGFAAMDIKHSKLTEKQKQMLNTGKRPVEISKFLESVRICTHNFENSNYGITVNDYTFDAEDDIHLSPLFFDPPYYEFDDLDEACKVVKNIEWARVKNYHLMKNTGTYERIIASAKEEKTSAKAEDLFKLFEQMEQKFDKKNNNDKNSNKNDNNNNSNNNAEASIVPVDDLDETRLKIEQEAAAKYNSNYPKVFGHSKTWYLKFLPEAGVSNVNNILTSSQEIELLIEYYRKYIGITEFDRKLLAKASANQESWQALFPQQNSNAKITRFDWKHMNDGLDISQINSYSDVVDFRVQLDILLTRFYIVMMYCKAALNLNVWKTPKQRQINLFSEVLMDLISIYKNITQLDEKKHGMMEVYLTGYQLFGYFMQLIKWMLSSEIYYCTVFARDTYWHLLVSDIKNMKSEVIAQIFDTIHNADTKDTMIRVLRNNGGLPTLFNNDFREFQQQYIDNDHNIEMDFKKLWCLPDLWSKYVPEPKPKESGNTKPKRKKGRKRGTTIFRGQGLKTDDEPPQKKTKIAATNDENLKEKLVETFKKTLDESWINRKDEIVTAQSSQSGDNDNSATIDYIVNLGLIFDDFTQKLPVEMIKEQEKILQNIQNGSNDETSTSSSKDVQKETK